MSLVKAFKGAKSPLLAAFDNEKPSPITLRKAICPKTGVELLVNACAKPFSPFSENAAFLKNAVMASTDEQVLSVKDQEKLTQVGTCDTCSSSFLTHASIAEKMDSGFTCTICGSFVVPPVKDNLTALEENGKEIIKKAGKKDKDVKAAADDSDYISEENVELDDVEDEPAEIREDRRAEENFGDRSEEGEDLLTIELPESGTEDQPDHFPEPENKDDRKDANEDMELNASLLQVLKSDLPKMDLCCGADSGVCYVFFDNKPVAFIKKCDLKNEMQELYCDAPKFCSVLKTALQNDMDEAVSDYSLNPINVQVPVDEAVAAHLATVQKEMQEAVSAKTEEVVERLSHSISVASMFVNKEVGSETRNPLKSEIVNAMLLCGIKDAESVVNKVFSKAMDSYTQAIIAKALELNSKSDEVRNEVANLVACASYRVQDAETASFRTKLNQPLVEVDASVESTQTQESGVSAMRKRIRFI